MVSCKLIELEFGRSVVHKNIQHPKGYKIIYEGGGGLLHTWLMSSIDVISVSLFLLRNDKNWYLARMKSAFTGLKTIQEIS